MMGEAHLEYNQEAVCPYCREENDDTILDVSHNGIDVDGDTMELLCVECDKNFKVIVHIDYTYSTEKLG